MKESISSIEELDEDKLESINFSKILEKIMFKRLSKFLIKNQTLFKSQYGFRENHSTEHAIYQITDQITEKLEKNTGY